MDKVVTLGGAETDAEKDELMKQVEDISEKYKKG